jgi:hypothetical protein
MVREAGASILATPFPSASQVHGQPDLSTQVLQDLAAAIDHVDAASERP